MCVINEGVTTQYFKLEKHARQGNSVAAYLYILCLEILFMIVKNNWDFKSLNILENTFLYTAYSDNKAFFLKNLGSIKEPLNKISLFSSFSLSLKHWLYQNLCF